MFPSSNLSPRARAEFNPQKAAEPAGNDASSAVQPENLATVEELDRLFADFADYARTFLNHSVYSIQWYRRGYQNFRVFLFEGAALPPSAFAVRLHAIEEWVRWNRRRGLSPIATNTYWRSLRRFFRDLEQRSARVNPFRDLKAPRFQKPVPKAKNGDDCRRILEAVFHYPWAEPQRVYKRALAHAVIAVMLLAGLRRSEVVRLRYAHVDLSGGTIRIANGKGIAGGRDRMAYISRELHAILVTYLRERERRGFTQPEFFVSAKNRRGLTLEGLRNIVEKVSTASGVAFSPHVLRHSFITHLLRSEVPLHIVKELAGHRDIATTLGYLRVFDDDLQRNIQKIRFT